MIRNCDETDSDYQETCFDSQDYDDITGLAPCKDGSQIKNYKDCPDREDKKNDKTKVIQKTTVIHKASASATATAVTTEESSCRLYGSTDGIQQKFNSIKYQACGLYPNGQKAYSDGFVMGCT